MAIAVNPFHELYVTETIAPESFVDVFSPLLVPDTMPLFQPGNVILMGVQGTGKSMLLALLKPEIRMAYSHAGKTFPVPEEFARFVGGGINLTRSGAIDFGQRPVVADGVDDLEHVPSYFGDFLNYWLVRDLLKSIENLQASGDGRLGHDLGLRASPRSLDGFAVHLARQPCWFGFLDRVKDYESLQHTLTQRLRSYREFLNHNADDISDDVRKTKTSIGEPVSVTAETLWKFEVVPPTVPFFLRVDQYEELSRLEDWTRERKLYQNYRAIVHKLLGQRDPRVSYRIGTRRHAWPDVPQMYGTSGVIEELRNFRIVDLDGVLRRREHTGRVFRDFANDVFERRVRHAKYERRDVARSFIDQVFGARMKPKEKARAYARDKPSAVVELEEHWPSSAKVCLGKLAEDNPLSAKLGEAWVRQQMDRKEPDLPSQDHLTWENKQKQWWKKERIDQALLQIAAAQRQRMIWSGQQDILALAGGNILAFVSLCQHVWDAWLRSLSSDSHTDRILPEISNPYVQNEGIELASKYWYRKIQADPDGNSRQRFATLLGRLFRSRLLKDRKMSYPGENGFSVPLEEIEDDREVKRHLADASAFGVLLDYRHTPKTRHLGTCRKWYLNPILSPHFQIPVAHTKEPMYVHAADVRQWLVQAKVLQAPPAGRPRPSGATGYLPLFDKPSGGKE